jgi:hypothetical protein
LIANKNKHQRQPDRVTGDGSQQGDYGKSKLVAELVSGSKTTTAILAGGLYAQTTVTGSNHLTATNLFLCISPQNGLETYPSGMSTKMGIFPSFSV